MSAEIEAGIEEVQHNELLEEAVDEQTEAPEKTTEEETTQEDPQVPYPCLP